MPLSIHTILMPTEQTIILAIIGMVGLFATATVYQRANRISSRYYNKK
jgi:1-deoxy-D-xylulose 5-phosphate reductoisomerase